MLEEKYLCVSYFDENIGPNLLLSRPTKPYHNDFPDLNRILEFSENPGSFLFAFRRYQSINYIFYMDSKIARGGKELLMISFLIRSSFFKKEIGEVLNYLNSKSEMLERFASEIIHLKDFNLILHRIRKQDPVEQDVIKLCEQNNIDFIKLFDKYYEELYSDPEIKIITKDATLSKKIFFIGPHGSGKSDFLKNVETLQFHRQENFNLSTIIFNVLIENIIIPDFSDDMMKNIDFNQTQGIIYLFKNSELPSLTEIKKDIEEIVSIYSSKPKEIVPILIIENNSDVIEPIKENEFYDKINLKELEKENIPIKFFSLNINTDDEIIIKALRWLIKKIV